MQACLVLGFVTFQLYFLCFLDANNNNKKKKKKKKKKNYFNNNNYNNNNNNIDNNNEKQWKIKEQYHKHQKSLNLTQKNKK